MTDSDFAVVEMKAQLTHLVAVWRADADWNRRLADAALSDDSRYNAGIADALERAIQALRALSGDPSNGISGYEQAELEDLNDRQ